MLRILAYMFGVILMISVLRSVIGVVLRLLVGGTMPSGHQGEKARPSAGARSTPVSEPLKRDPVCGTYVAPSASVQTTKGGQTYYFCSTGCRDKFAA